VKNLLYRSRAQSAGGLAVDQIGIDALVLACFLASGGVEES